MNQFILQLYNANVPLEDIAFTTGKSIHNIIEIVHAYKVTKRAINDTRA